MNEFFRLTAFFVLLSVIAALSSSCGFSRHDIPILTKVRTVTDAPGKIGEPFGIAVLGKDLFVSDGAKGIVWKIDAKGAPTIFATGFSTPSHIAFDGNGTLFVADSGDHTIRKVAPDGSVAIAAGVSGKGGFRDGPASEALFNAPIGIAAAEGKVYVADTYNDRIRVIEDGKVTTIAGGTQGFRDSGDGISARFNTPIGLSLFGNNLLVADTGNRRIRVVEPDGKTGTLAGSLPGFSDGLLGEAKFLMPVAITVNKSGSIFLTDGNSVRVIRMDLVPIVRTIGDGSRGFADGSLRKARFNRPSGLAIGTDGDVLIADSDNSLVRVLTGTGKGKDLVASKFAETREVVAEFRNEGRPRWPFKAFERPREIAGTFGEIRGEQTKGSGNALFHNGLDISGGYGEEAVAIRTEKILWPVAVSGFGTNRENIRFPGLGYVHLRLGRNAEETVFTDRRFQFLYGKENKPVGLRIPRGTIFEAGDVLGTLNAMHHVHLIAGPPGRELNALQALELPGIADGREPVLEDVKIFDRDWREFENKNGQIRINQNAQLRVVARTYDQMDGNPERRRLGLYKLGYQLLNVAKQPLRGHESPKWTIIFDMLPSGESASLVYAEGSRSGATGETVFNYVVSNMVNGKKTSEEFVKIKPDAGKAVVLRIFAADYFGNSASKDIKIVFD